MIHRGCGKRRVTPLGGAPQALTPAESQTWRGIAAAAPVGALRRPDGPSVWAAAVALTKWQAGKRSYRTLRRLVRALDLLLIDQPSRRRLLFPEVHAMTHASPPTICATCRANVATLAEATGASPVVSFCDHDAAPLVTFIVAHVRGGAIFQWDLSGPMALGDAQRHAARIAHLAPPAPQPMQ